MPQSVQSVQGGQYHWRKNCSDYPALTGHSTYTRPEGYLCDQCRAKERDGACRE
jgi:predicted SprT family Zn-dependent metalloprotease